MPRSFLVKKNVDRIFRSYRCGTETMVSPETDQQIGHHTDSLMSSGPRGISSLWPIALDQTLQKNCSSAVRENPSDIFLQLPPTLIQPLAVRVNSGYVYDPPLLFPRASFPLGAAPPFCSLDRPEHVHPSIDLLSHRTIIGHSTKPSHHETDTNSLDSSTIELKSLTSPLSSSASLSPHSPNCSSADFSPSSAADRSDIVGTHRHRPRASDLSSGVTSPSGVGAPNEGGDSAPTTPTTQRRCNAFQDGVTVGYTYDAFFVSDGRSRRRNVLGVPEQQTRQRYKCSECGKHYATSSNLSRHKQTHRSLDSQQAKQCPHCQKVYVSMPALSMHILTHDLKYQCSVCAKAFSRPWLLQGHLRSHTGEKPFGCAHCGKAFADRSNLRAHMQTHSSFKLYTCKRCSKSFALKAYLNKHLESACFKDDEEDDCSSETSIWSV